MKSASRFSLIGILFVLLAFGYFNWKDLSVKRQIVERKNRYFLHPDDQTVFEELRSLKNWAQGLQGKAWIEEWISSEIHLKHFLLRGALILKVPPMPGFIETILQTDALDEKILALQWASQNPGNEAVLRLGFQAEQPYAVRAFVTLFLDQMGDFAKWQEWYISEKEWRIRSLFRIVLWEKISPAQLQEWLKQYPGALSEDLAHYYLGIEQKKSRSWEEWSALFSKGIQGTHHRLFEKRFSSENEDAFFLRQAYHYLARHQEEEGYFDCSKYNPFHNEVLLPGFTCEDNQVDLAMTGLALLAFLAEGSTDRLGPYAEGIQKARDFLLSHQKEGKFETWEGTHHNSEVFVPYRNTRVTSRLVSKQGGATLDLVHRYNHCICMLALLELYGMTLDPKLVTPIEQGLQEFTRRQGNLKKRVIPKTSFSYYIELGDVATTAYLVQSVFLAKQLGFKVDETLVDDLKTYVENTNFGKGNTAPSLLRAYCFGGHSSVAVTLVMEKFSKLGRIEVEQQERQFLLQNLPTWKLYPELPETVEETQKDYGNIVDFHYWYYGSRALYLTGGNDHFLDELKKILPHATLNYGDELGSIKPEGIWCRVGGRLYSTIMTILAIQVPKAETYSFY